MKNELETLADLREKLTEIQDGLEGLAHENRALAHAISGALTPLFDLREALYSLEKKSENESALSASFQEMKAQVNGKGESGTVVLDFSEEKDQGGV